MTAQLLKMNVVACLVVGQLNKTFSGPGGGLISAVQDLSFAVTAGELFVLLGPSGCGKTTTLRLIAGLESPDSGRIALDGQDMDHVPPQHRNIGMVFQGGALFPHLNVFENIALGLRLRKVPRAEIDSRVRETSRTVGLEGRLASFPAELSGGERQRVAVCRALVRRPALLLLDEPFVHLDVPLRRELRRELRRWHAESGLTMILVTHDQPEAMVLGNRVAVMNTGKIEQIAAPDELKANPSTPFVAAFLDSAPI